MGRVMDVITEWLQQHTGRIILLVIVMAVAMIATRVLARITNEVLERASIPNASIFANILRVIIWAAVITIVLQPVFGVNPTTLLAALGVGGVAIFPGYAGYDREHHQRVRAHARQGDPARRPGAHPRHHRRGQGHHLAADFVILERGGNQMVIPNSVLNTSSLEKLTQASEGYVPVPFTVAAGSDLKEVERRALDVVNKATESMRLENVPTLVKFTGFTSHTASPRRCRCTHGSTCSPPPRPMPRRGRWPGPTSSSSTPAPVRPTTE